MQLVHNVLIKHDDLTCIRYSKAPIHHRRILTCLILCKCNQCASTRVSKATTCGILMLLLDSWELSEELQIEVRRMLHHQDQLADCRCDSGNPFDVPCYHACLSQHNLQGRSSSTRSGIWDLVTMAPISMRKSQLQE